jgi:hypothetical protein
MLSFNQQLEHRLLDQIDQMKLLTKTFILAASAVCLLGNHANATVINFDGPLNYNTIFGDGDTGNGLIVGSDNGYNFTSSRDHFHFIDWDSWNPSPNFGGVLLQDGNYAITMVQGNGGAFSLLGMSFNSTDPQGGITESLLVTGFFTGGGSISTTLSVDSMLYWQTTTFSGFTGLSSVTFDGIGGAGEFLLDDITTGPGASSVPDGGSSIALLGLALTGLAALRRKLIG